MADTTFVSGTIIASDWLNDVNTVVYGLPTASGATGVGVLATASLGGVLRSLQTKLNELPSSYDYSGRGTFNYGFGVGTLASLAPVSSATATQSIAIGNYALNAMTTGFANVAIGHNTLKLLTENAYTTAIGAFALENANIVGNVNLLCTAVGAYALNANTDGQYNTAVGAYSGQHNTTGYFNTYVGQNSGVQNTTGTSNVAVGHSALQLNIGSRNVAVGDASLPIATGVSDSVAIGYHALATNLTGNQSVAIGTNALATMTVGPNIAIGYRAGESVGLGAANTIVGWQAGLNVQTTGTRHTLFGHEAGTLLTSNSDCTAFGYRALATSVCQRGTAVGANALANMTNGDSVGNTAVGFNAGANVTTGANNAFFGPDSGTDAVANVTTASNRIVIGNNSHTNAFIKVAFTVVSDARDKTDIVPLTSGLDFVKNLQPKAFKLKDRATGLATTGVRYGFLAQDVAALDQGRSELVNSEDADHLKMNEAMMIPILVKAIQELQAEVAALKAK
jgi:hypothetical protein